MPVYLIHFEKPIGEKQIDEARDAYGLPQRTNGYTSHARHYLGSTNNITRRMCQHERGYGGRLMAHVTSSGVRWRIIRTWELDSIEDERVLESRLKRHGHNPDLCPACNPDGWERHVDVGETGERKFGWRGKIL